MTEIQLILWLGFVLLGASVGFGLGVIYEKDEKRELWEKNLNTKIGLRPAKRLKMELKPKGNPSQSPVDRTPMH